MTLGVLGATIAGGAAAYFFLGPKGKQHRHHAKAWAIKMKADVIEKLETAQEMINETAYRGIVDTIAEEYKKGRKIGKEEVDALAQELKKHWKTLSGSAATAKRKVSAKAKKTALKGQ